MNLRNRLHSLIYDFDLSGDIRPNAIARLANLIDATWGKMELKQHVRLAPTSRPYPKGLIFEDIDGRIKELFEISAKASKGLD